MRLVPFPLRPTKEDSMTARRMPVIAAALVAACLFAGRAHAWGPEGHVIVARIAELNLSDKTKQALADLLPDTAFSGSSSIADTHLASYPDFVRHNSNFPQYESSGP